LTMGIITWKTGGIEMAVLLHAVNNLALVLIAPMIPSLLQQGGESPWVLLASVTPKIVLLVGLWIWVSRREGVGLWEPVRGRGRLGGRLG
ncbi:MAG: CPBP family intramembrane metalloprotease, partial [Micrococcus sp.]|nr:CPBP family intramembrane metalloprotease [Micrococcus sp.]